jgi:CubicO group peptidase (beta-lactamase class C family)
MDLHRDVAAPDPRAAGFDPNGLAAIDGVLLCLIERRRLPGAVTLVVRDGRLAWFSALGFRDPATEAPMRRDAIFRIHSMTKPITSVALMRLVEQGRVLLSDAVARYLPVFGAAEVQVETPAGPHRVAPRRPMTVQDLLRHTAGLTYEFLEATPVRALYAQADLGARERSSAEQVHRLAGLPLMHEPGSVWDYSRATDVVGRLVEVLADEALGAHLRRTLFEPLGMVDTGFHVPPTQHRRIAEPFAEDPDSGAAVGLADVRQPAALECGGSGLVSTVADYARFLRMLLEGGTLDGVRILGRKTVEHMTSDHLGAIPTTGDALPPGHGFGLGFAVRLVTGVAALPGSTGTYGWGGSAGTLFFVDPLERLLAVMMVQAPGQRVEVQELFRTLVYAALE